MSRCKEINSKGGEFGHTGLHYAAGYNHPEVVKLLLSREDIDVNIKGDVEGATALQLAVSWGHTEVVKLLLSHRDIDVNTPELNHYSYTPLHHAAGGGHVEVVELASQQSDQKTSGASVAPLNQYPMV